MLKLILGLGAAIILFCILPGILKVLACTLIFLVISIYCADGDSKKGPGSESMFWFYVWIGSLFVFPFVYYHFIVPWNFRVHIANVTGVSGAQIFEMKNGRIYKSSQEWFEAPTGCKKITTKERDALADDQIGKDLKEIFGDLFIAWRWSNSSKILVTLSSRWLELKWTDTPSRGSLAAKMDDYIIEHGARQNLFPYRTIFEIECNDQIVTRIGPEPFNHWFSGDNIFQ